MTTDTRTEAERRYDATALSSRPHIIAQATGVHCGQPERDEGGI